MQIQRIVDPRAAVAERVFRACENGNASDPLVPGDIVEYQLAATAAYPGVSVVDGTDNDPLVAGVVVGANLNGGNIVADAFGLMQVSGFCSVLTTDTNVVAGDPIMPAASAVADTGTLGTNDGLWIGVALADDATANLPSAVIKGNLV